MDATSKIEKTEALNATRLNSVIPESGDLVTTLRAHRVFLRSHGFPETDVRLQVHTNGQWQIHCGDASYDQDHRGYWGAGTLSKRDTLQDLRNLAADLTCQAADMEADDGTP